MFQETASLIPSIWESMNSWFTPTVLFVFLNIMIGTIAITSSYATPKPTDSQKEQNHQQQQQHQRQQQQQQSFQDHPQLVRSPSMLQRLKSMNFCSYKFPEPNTATFTHHYDPPTPATAQYFNTDENEHQQQQQPPPQLDRSPSMLERLKSINLYNYLSPDSANPTHESRESADIKSNDDSILQQGHAQEHHLQAEEQEDEYEKNKGEADDYIQDQEQTFEEIYSKLKGGATVSRTKSDTEPASGALPSKLPKKMKKSASSKSAFSHFKEEDIVENRRPATVREGKTQIVDDEVDAKADDFINKFKQQLKLQRIDSITRYKEMVGRGSG